MEWIGEPLVSQGVREQRFDVKCDGRRVPALLWTAEAGGEGRPLALLGHGGTLHKRADYILATARRLARRHGISSLAIDGPGHGERRSDGGSDLQAIVREIETAWGPEIADETVADWKAALDAVEGLQGEVPLGYFGLSMGTMLGLPFVVAERRVRAAVLGLMGVWGVTAKRLAEDAPRLTCPVRFLMQWDDEIVPRETALELFDVIGSRHKGLRAHPGRHVEVPPEEMRGVVDFLAAHLT